MSQSVELVNQSKRKDCEATSVIALGCASEKRQGVWCTCDVSSYRQVWRQSVMSRTVSMWGGIELLLQSSDVLSCLQMI